MDDPKLNSSPTLFSVICPFLIAYLIFSAERTLCPLNMSGLSFLVLIFVHGPACKFRLSPITIFSFFLFPVSIATSLVQNLTDFAETVSVALWFHPASCLVFLLFYALLLDLTSVFRNRILTLLLSLKKAITIHTKLSAVYFQPVLFATYIHQWNNF